MKNKPKLKSLCKPIDPKNPFNQPHHTPTPNGYKGLSEIDLIGLKAILEPHFHKFATDDILRAVNAYEKDQEIKRELLKELKINHREYMEVLTEFKDFPQHDFKNHGNCPTCKLIAKAEGK